MTLRTFLDCAYALLVEEFQRFGEDLISAIEKVSNLGMENVEVQPENEAAQNQSSLAELNRMMAGVVMK